MLIVLFVRFPGVPLQPSSTTPFATAKVMFNFLLCKF